MEGVEQHSMQNCFIKWQKGEPEWAGRLSSAHNHEEKECEVVFDHKMNSKQCERKHKKENKDVQVKIIFIRNRKASAVTLHLEYWKLLRELYLKGNNSKWNWHRND